MLSRQQVAARALTSMGFTRLARGTRHGQVCILTFHGLATQEDSAELLDGALHTPPALFAEICAHLASHYRVMPLQDIADALAQNAPLPPRAVGITFDDGYESNHRLAFPVLRHFSLPATVFLCTGFVDGTARPWFHRLELAMARETAREINIRIGDSILRFLINSPAARAAALGALLRAFKRLPQAEVADALARVEEALRPATAPVPRALRPLSWDQVREMRDSGLVDFGAHTHTHPILGRCAGAVARDEILASRDRIRSQLGAAPALFAYPNGLDGDYSSETVDLLRTAGFRAAFTMIPGFAKPGPSTHDVPRYGSPESLPQLEATVSGAFENFKEWRRKLRRAFVPSIR